MGNQKLYCFDFDGTLTTSDSMVGFIRYVCGTWGLVYAFAMYLPLMILMKLGLYPNWKTKEKVLRHCFAGMSVTEFRKKAEEYAAAHRNILRQETLSIMRNAIANGNKVMVVSASVVDWVAPFFKDMPEVTVTGTLLESMDGVLTGNLATPNCYGPEKVKHIKECYPNRDEYYIVAFGDSRGDREMLEYADEGYLLKGGEITKINKEIW